MCNISKRVWESNFYLLKLNQTSNPSLVRDNNKFPYELKGIFFFLTRKK